MDDDPGIRRLLELVLRDEDFEVTLAADGAEGLSMARNAPPDLVILDVEMPVMDGPSCFRAMQEEGLHPSCIVLSAHGARGVADELGAEAAIDKPFDPQDVVGQVRRLTGR